MFNTSKIVRNTKGQNIETERRRNFDRRVSTSDTRFPFIDDNSKLVMKDRRIAKRRTSDTKVNNPLKIVKGIFKK